MHDDVLAAALKYRPLFYPNNDYYYCDLVRTFFDEIYKSFYEINKIIDGIGKQSDWDSANVKIIDECNTLIEARAEKNKNLIIKKNAVTVETVNPITPEAFVDSLINELSRNFGKTPELNRIIKCVDDLKSYNATNNTYKNSSNCQQH